MAEYYPLLAKAVGSLPNSTPETRRVVYERARKALIGQLRTLHPPVPDEDIEHESVELDRAIERLEAELASAAPAAVPTPAAATGTSTSPPQAASNGTPPRPTSPVPPAVPPKPAARPALTLPGDDGSLGPPGKPFPPLRTKTPLLRLPSVTAPSVATSFPNTPPITPPAVVPAPTATAAVPAAVTAPALADAAPSDPAPVAPDDDIRLPRGPTEGKPKLEAQRPIAPQPPPPREPARRMWIIPVGIGVVVLLVAVAAWKLKDRPQTVARVKPVEQTKGETGKIAERVGGPAKTAVPATVPVPTETPPASSTAAATPSSAPSSTAPTPAASAKEPPAASNPDLPVAHRAALLVEAPEEANKVKTYIGTVVWKLNTVNDGPNEAASLAVEADIDLPDDKTKATVTFEKNSDASLPASHTIKVRFFVQQGSPTGDIKQISVPQMRNEDSPSGEALNGVTVPVIQDSFLVGLSPGTAEATNMQLLKTLQWIDIPMLLTSGKIAKLTFEKSDAGQRDIDEAITAWRKS